jgi:hypothetical protein
MKELQSLGLSVELLADDGPESDLSEDELPGLSTDDLITDILSMPLENSDDSNDIESDVEEKEKLHQSIENKETESPSNNDE